jgi:hypothetical protein
VWSLKPMGYNWTLRTYSAAINRILISLLCMSWPLDFDSWRLYRKWRHWGLGPVPLPLLCSCGCMHEQWPTTCLAAFSEAFCSSLHLIFSVPPCVCLSVCLSVCPSICLSVCLSVLPSVFVDPCLPTWQATLRPAPVSALQRLFGVAKKASAAGSGAAAADDAPDEDVVAVAADSLGLLLEEQRRLKSEYERMEAKLREMEQRLRVKVKLDPIIGCHIGTQCPTLHVK